MYILVLTTTVGLVFLIYPLLPPVYGRLILLVVAAVWGVGIVALPCGLYGTSRWEKDCSRHVGWLISTLFALFMIYCFYLVDVRINGTSTPAPSSSPLEGDQTSTDSSDEFWWRVAFAVLGSYVLAGYLWAWFRVRIFCLITICSAFFLFLLEFHHVNFPLCGFWMQGCWTGGDRDRSP